MKPRTERISAWRVSVVRDSAPPEGLPVVPADSTCRSPHDAAPLLLPFLQVDSGRESFVMLMLDTRARPLGVVVISRGTLNATLVSPREVFRPAILAGACSLIFAHCHPSGDTTPSEDDIMLTERLYNIGALHGIEVRDHLVFGNDAATKPRSMREDSTFATFHTVNW